MIHVNTNKTVKPIRNFWNNIIFHPTDAIEDDWGKRILDAVSEDNAVDTVRIYNMLEDIVTKDENGNLCYDYTLNDYRLDYLISKGFDIYLTYAFMPSCLAQDPNVTGVCAKGKTRYKGKMIITTPPKDYSKPEGYVNIKSIRKDFSSIDTEEDNIVERMLDENVNTHWGAKGRGRYVDFELERETNIENVEIVFNPNNARNAAFEIHTSLDGKTWETVFVGAGDGSVEAGSWEKFVFDIPKKAKWIRYVANGSNKSEWNGVKEIRFKEAK